MKLFELDNKDNKNDLKDFYDPEQDQSIIVQGNTRKSKLTLGQINGLRRMYDAKKFEKSKKYFESFVNNSASVARASSSFSVNAFAFIRL